MRGFRLSIPWRAAAAGAVLALTLGALAAGAAEPPPARELAPRSLAARADLYHLAPADPVARGVVKFHEGTHVRLRNGGLVPGERSDRERERLAALGLTPARVAADAGRAQRLITRAPAARNLGRLIRLDEASLAELKRRGERRSGRELADLALYFEIAVAPGARFADVAELLDALNALPSVEVAYAEPPAEPAALPGEPELVATSNTPDFQSQQGYLAAAPQGIDAFYAWGITGGKGQNVKIVDVEGAWRTTHEDMPTLFHTGGTQYTSLSWRNHGTAVLGEMVGIDNGYGVTGIVNQAQAGYESIGSQSTASAIANAATAAGSGGLVLIELHAPGPANSTPCTCNLPQCDYIAMEYWQANFDAIATAVANGVTVVEAGGNGSSNLDDGAYGGLFSRAVRDSGAILVGASLSTSRTPTCWTNFGSRVDVHAWGENVVTMGYGDLYNGGTEDLWYTSTFSGTSSASPIVTGAAASVQGSALASGNGALPPRVVRQLLKDTGTPQATSSKQIGPMPDLRAALDKLAFDRAAYQCWIDITGLDTCTDYIVLSRTPGAVQQDVEVDLSSGYVRLDLVADVCDPIGWWIHVADSPTANGGGGDAGTTDHDAEAHVRDTTFDFFGTFDYQRGQVHPWKRVRDAVPAGGCFKVHFTVMEDELRFDDDGNPFDPAAAVVQSIRGFEVSPYAETDNEDPAGLDADHWYVGLNRTFGSLSRAGDGLQRACFVLSTTRFQDPAAIANLCP